jgi:UDPglucose 6-dehydrogenase
MRISVFGLGKVGLTLATSLAAAGREVCGVDVSETLVARVNEGIIATDEVGVMDRLSRTIGHSFRATTDVEDAVANSDVSFVIVPTPSNQLGGFSNAFVLRVCDQLGRALRAKSTPHAVSVVSTMLPGSSDYSIIPALESASGRKVGEMLHYCYNPAFIALGEVVKGFETPDYLLIGEATAACGQRVLDALRPMIRNEAPIARMSPIEAEIAKVASNTHETMRVTFANMLLSICAEVPGTNVDRITGALSYRMGRRFFKGAVPYGGPCWPRDNIALAAFMDAIGTPSTLPRTVHASNDDHGRFVLRKVLELAPRGSTIGLLGLAYKPDTPMIEESYAVKLAQWLVADGRLVVGWDPLVNADTAPELAAYLRFTATPEDCLSEASLVVLVNTLACYEAVDWSRAADATVLDCWRCLSRSHRTAVGHYLALGDSQPCDLSEWIEGRAGAKFRLITS